MRIFAGDAVPGLALLSQALPAPWVMPDAIGERHRDRLAGVLYRALHGARPELRMVEIHWGERDLVRMGRIKLPPAIMIRWRVPALLGVDRSAVMREAQRISPELSLFDFGRMAGDQALAWLGPLKQEVLHRLIDALADHPPMGYAEAIVDHLQDLAGKLRSPVDLIDAAELMVEHVMLGLTPRSARAEACARIVAARFDEEDADMDAAVIIRALVQVAGQAEITAESRRLLDRAGLTEPGATRPLPLADLLTVGDVMERTQRLIVSRFPLRERIPELALDIPVAEEPRVMEQAAEALRVSLAEPRVAEPDIQAAEQALDMPEQPVAELPLALREAQTRASKGELEAAASLIFNEIRSGRTTSWSNAHLIDAAGFLLFAAQKLREGLPAGSPKLAVASEWLEASAMACVLADHDEGAAHSYLLAARSALEADNSTRAEKLLNECTRIAGDPGSNILIMQTHILSAQIHEQRGMYAEAKENYEAAIALASELDDRQSLAILHLKVGRICVSVFQRGDDAQHAYEAALAIYEELGDSEGQALTLSMLAALRLERLQIDEAITHCTRALELLIEDAKIKASLHLTLGAARVFKDDWAEARQQLELARNLYQEQRNTGGYTWALLYLYALHMQLHEIVHARALSEAALDSSRAAHDRGLEVHGLNGMGEVQRWLGDLAGSARSHQRALELARAVEDARLEANCLRSLGQLSIWTGDLVESQRRYEQALSIMRKLRSGSPIPPSTFFLASVLIAQEKDARDLVAKGAPVAAATGIPVQHAMARLLEAALLYFSDDREAAMQIWTEVAEYLQKSRRKAEAAQVSAMLAAARGQPLDQVADDLREVLGTTHPLPERLRQAPDADSAIRTIVPFLFT